MAGRYQGVEGYLGEHFPLKSKPLNEQAAWAGPIVMDSRQEMGLAFKELQNGIFIKHKTDYK